MTTTIAVPPAIAALERPEGTEAGAEALADTVLASASRFSEFADEAETLAAPNFLWSGSASSAYSQHAKAFGAGYAPIGDALKRVARGIDVFADQLKILLDEHEGLVSEISSYHGYRNDLIADVQAATKATEAEIAELKERARLVRILHGNLVTEITEFSARVTANEDYLTQLFTASDTTEEIQRGGGISPIALNAIGGMPSSDAGPEEMAEWWNGLSEQEQDALIAGYPERLGSADGLPAAARDQANRLLLDSDLNELRLKEENGTLSEDEEQLLKNAEATEKALKYADEYTVPGTDDQPGGSLWLYDPSAFDGDGRVAIALGDLDTADDVAIQIPGIKTQMDGVAGNVKDAANLYESARNNGDGSSVASMFWLGYDTPAGDPSEWLDVPSENAAADGGRRLADAVDGLRASRSDDPAHMTAIGHSYGSTATSYAATDHGLAVDDVALIGSPGTGPAGDASDFSVGKDHVFVGRNSRDFVAYLGDEGWLRKDSVEDLGLGVDPSSEDFDATRFEAEATDRKDTARWTPDNVSDLNFDDHVKYYERDSESLYNLGRIVDGESENINKAPQSYDPWYSPAVDEEWWRTPTSNDPGRSDTGADG